ncbi:condensation domain-containing protein [Rhodococcoides yunnanense]|uniref:condensation domain-containing protein n=1 Tax=Rhodococcoides yunnanense TaxID=278209 RepID=UPI0009FBCB95|nr:condensation domain-containing protein [Rhodococcus yunnanensis]
MIITALSNWKPKPGRLLEWHPTEAALVAARAAAVHPAPASFLQEDHLRATAAAAARGDAHHAYTGVATEIDGSLDADALTRAVRAYVLRHEGLRCWFEVTDSVLTRRLGSDSVASFEPTDAGTFATDAEFQNYVRARFSSEATAFEWPGFVVGAVERDSDFTLYYGADHAFTDGGSQALVISELADLYALEIGESVPELAEAGSHLDYAIEERALATRYGPTAPEIVAWKEIFQRNEGKMPRFPLDLGLAEGEKAPVRIVERYLLDADATASLDRACKAAGARLSSGVFAAVAIADYELAGRADYFGITVLSTRHLGDYGQSQGWFVNFAPVAFPVGGASTFAAVAARAHEAFEKAKQISAAPVHAVLGALAADGTLGSELAVSPNMLSYIDFRWFPGVGRPADARAEHFTGEGSTANASMWINRDADHFYLCAQVPDTAVAAESVERYHAHLQRVFESVARTGDYVIGSLTTDATGRPEELIDAGHHDH